MTLRAARIRLEAYDHAEFSYRERWRRFDAAAFFNHVIDILFKLLIFFVVLVLATGLVKLFWASNIYHLFDPTSRPR